MGNKTAKLSPKTVQELQKCVGEDFSTDEIRQWYGEYRQSLTPGNNQLSREAFVNVYNRLFQGDATKFAEQVFRSFDLNRNGYVDFQEFIVGLSVSGSTDNQKKWEWAFSVYDMDGDGFISPDEMHHIIEAIFLMTGAKLPADCTSTKQLSDKMFASLDSNGDKLVSKEEFISGAKTNKFIIDILECDPEITE